jgi:mono/diheme cytochrome c family protein
MPPTGERLTAAQISLLRDWIDQGAEWGEEAASVEYARDIQPIFEARCYSCHGNKVQTHGLRLDRRSSPLKGGDSGAPAIVPGSSASSLLVRYVSGTDRVVMPPVGDRLDTAQVELLKKWIDAGAEWTETAAVEREVVKRADHWAFKPAVRPAVPRVRNGGWVRNPIDAFVLAKLEARGWKPAAAAAPRDLMRRL